MFSEIVLTISKNKKVIQAMDNNQLYNQYSAEYRQANDYHGQLSTKEFELQLINIGMKNDTSANSFQGQLSKMNLEMEIHALKQQRNAHICSAINYVLDLANNEITNSQGIIISLAYMALSAINSFISTQNIELSLPSYLQVKLNQISDKLIMSNMTLLNLKSEVSRLKLLCKI